eukprot:COSAG01_NODE_4313_length_5140_cov_145.783773_2_plen_117_part_00
MLRCFCMLGTGIYSCENSTTIGLYRNQRCSTFIHDYHERHKGDGSWVDSSPTNRTTRPVGDLIYHTHGQGCVVQRTGSKDKCGTAYLVHCVDCILSRDGSATVAKVHTPCRRKIHP